MRIEQGVVWMRLMRVESSSMRIGVPSVDGPKLLTYLSLYIHTSIHALTHT